MGFCLSSPDRNTELALAHGLAFVGVGSLKLELTTLKGLPQINCELNTICNAFDTILKWCDRLFDNFQPLMEQFVTIAIQFSTICIK